MTTDARTPRGASRPVGRSAVRTLGHRRRWALVGLLVVVTLVAVFARLLAPYDPIQPVGA